MRRISTEQSFFIVNTALLVVAIVIGLVVLVKVFETREIHSLEDASDSDTTPPTEDPEPVAKRAPAPAPGSRKASPRSPPAAR